jgi:hypothetical protein
MNKAYLIKMKEHPDTLSLLQGVFTGLNAEAEARKYVDARNERAPGSVQWAVVEIDDYTNGCRCWLAGYGVDNCLEHPKITDHRLTMNTNGVVFCCNKPAAAHADPGKDPNARFWGGDPDYELWGGYD